MWRGCHIPLAIVVAATLQLWTIAVDAKRPHIVFVLADDYGFNDVGYHGSEIKTPNLDEISSRGVRLENYYVQPSCSPSRSQFMSGRYQIRTGLQHSIIWSTQANALPRDSPTIADKLRQSGYATHMVGKWHLGFYKKEFIPINRGFDTFYGFYSGSQGYFSHALEGFKHGQSYLDLRDQDRPVFNESGHYSTHLFTDKAIQRIRSHDPSKPFFLYLAYQAVHSPMQVPNAYKDQYGFIDDDLRKTYAAMTSAMDEGIGNLTQALKEADMWEDTVFVFSTDNGGIPVAGGNNYPLRSYKGSLFEGGIRGVGFVHAANMKTPGTVNRALMHITDWYPTFVGLAGGSLNDTKPLDGVDQWNAIRALMHISDWYPTFVGLAGDSLNDTKPLDGVDQWNAISQNQPGPRKELLHNIDPRYDRIGRTLYPNAFDTRIRAALRVDDWKIVTGDPYSKGWNRAPPHSRGAKENFHPEVSDPEDKNLWLFNIKDDPSEQHDLSAKHPNVVQDMLDKLAAYSAESVPVRFPPRYDPRLKLPLIGGVWGPWVDVEPVYYAFYYFIPLIGGAFRFAFSSCLVCASCLVSLIWTVRL